MRNTALALVLAVISSGCATSPRSPVDCWIASAGAPTSVYREGTFHVGGIDGTFRTWSAADGSYRSESTAGPHKEVSAMSGGKGWTRGGEGQPHAMTGPELQAAISDAFMENPAAFPHTAVQGADPETFIVTPRGGVPLTIRFDAGRCAPRTISRPQAERTTTFSVVSWSPVKGRSFPLELVQSSGDAKYDVRLSYTNTRVGEPVDAALFQWPAAETAVRLPEGKRFIEIPFELTQNHIYVPVSVNRGRASSFVLDTGAEFTVIESSHAKVLGLEAKGSLEGRGAGEASISAGMLSDLTLGIGSLDFPLDSAFTIPLTPIWLREGRAMEGIIGYDVLSHFIVEIDYAARIVRLHDPAQFTAPADAAAFPVTFDGNMPVIDALVELPTGRRIAGRMTLDTGSRGALSLNTPFIEKHEVMKEIAATVSGPLGLGVGGATTQQIGRIAALHIGPYSVASAVTSFSRDAKGANASPDISGNIGGELLRRFTFWVDYSGARILLRPNAQFAEAFEYDMSGLLLEAADVGFRRFLVRIVLDGSPAAESGILAGDEVLGIDGAPIEGTTLEALRKRFAEPGRSFVLTIRREGTERQITLTTRRMI